MASTSVQRGAPFPPTAEAVSAYLSLWTDGLRLDGLAERIARVTTDDVRFVDPFNDVSGRAALQLIIEDMLTRCVGPAFEIKETALGDERAYVRWRFSFETKRGRAIAFDGVSSLTFRSDGLCASHIDHWDSQEIYGLIPVLGGVIRMIKRRLAH